MITRLRARRNLSVASKGEFVEATLDVLRAYGRGGHWLRIAEVADFARMPVRSFQRNLSTEDSTFTELVDQARFELATEMLDGNETTVVDIAELLGYLYQGDFTRAWKRWTGVTPHGYRLDKRSKRQSRPHHLASRRALRAQKTGRQ